ncbi:Zinc finger BED domain-containing protein RICESLEEPER 2 [Linum grandiflorum]
MAVTGHFINNSDNLRALLLRFLYLPAPHTSERLVSSLSDCLLDWNIDSKLSTITLDNCTTNDSLIKLVKQKLVLVNLIKDGELIHMRCSAHILNLIVRDGLDVIKEAIENIRDSVVFWTCTPRRVEYFHDRARQLKLNVVNKLVLDCPKRWNSTYKMLMSAILYKVVFFRLNQMESQYTSLPSDKDWEFASVVCDKLEVFSKMTEIFSLSKYPTANQFFPKDNVKVVVTDLVSEYQMKYVKNHPSSSTSKFQTTSSADLDFDLFVSQKKKSKPTIVTTELDHYLADDLYPRDVPFDMLNW